MSAPTRSQGPSPSPSGAPPRTPPPMFGGRPMGGLGVPTQKAKNFKGTLVRLLGYLRPHRRALAVVVAAGAVGTVFSVLGPKILGLATTTIFKGFVAKAAGVPGAAIDFAAVGRILAGLIVLYVVGNAFQYLMQYLMAHVAQRTVYALRREVEAKFDRLPLKFFDSRTRGELMSRAVNDLDSISGTLQQNLTQLLTSVLTLVGVIVMMLTHQLDSHRRHRADAAAEHGHRRRHRQALAAVLHAAADGAGRAERARGRDVRRPHHRHRLRPRAAVDRHLRHAQRQVLRGRLAGAVRQRHHHADDDVRRQPRVRLRRGDRRVAGHAAGRSPSATCRPSSSTPASSPCRSCS